MVKHLMNQCVVVIKTNAHVDNILIAGNLRIDMPAIVFYIK